MLLPAGPVVGFQCGPALVGCGAVVVLVVFSLPDLWLLLGGIWMQRAMRAAVWLLSLIHISEPTRPY